MRHWKVSFVRRGMEPPTPFGKQTLIVCAPSREEAKRQVPASPAYPVRASGTHLPVSFTMLCRCIAKEPSP